jgi:hypothetical protein
MRVYDKSASGVFVLSNIRSIAKSAIFGTLPSADRQTEDEDPSLHEKSTARYHPAHPAFAGMQP